MHSTKIILITGGAGFIGANLVRRLLNEKAGIIHLVIEPQSDVWRLTDVIDQIVIHECDITNFLGITKLVTTLKPSVIFHLASYGGMPQQQDQKIIYQVNLDATINLVNACKLVGFECFINTGSSSEYGIQHAPMAESTLLEPISDYGVSKAAATQFCLKEALFNNLPIYTIRPFSVYGDYEGRTRLIPTVLINTLLEKPLTLSSPHFVRDYIYIDDMINLYMTVMNQQPRYTFIFNGGTGVQSTIGDVIAAVQHLSPTKMNLVWGIATPRPWEPHSWVADITRAQATLSWRAHCTLSEGLKKSMCWFEENISLYNREKYAYNTSSSQQNTTSAP